MQNKADTIHFGALQNPILVEEHQATGQIPVEGQGKYVEYEQNCEGIQEHMCPLQDVQGFIPYHHTISN